MENKIIATRDGSHTVAIPTMGVTYHSIHGAISESMHVFIEAGLKCIGNEITPLHILEMGFGTGLNALLTMEEAHRSQLLIYYTALELFPLEKHHALSLNYCEQLKNASLLPLFEQLHQSGWEEDVAISHYFTIRKLNCDLLNYSTHQLFDLVYFDAFAPSAQPELWTKDVFMKLKSMMRPGGIFVTYCSKGDVRRAMQAAGFNVERIPGPPGKREMIRAFA